MKSDYWNVTDEQVIEKTDQGIRVVAAGSRFIQKCPD